MNILAEKDPTAQIVIVVLFAVFWVVAQIAGAITKKKKQQDAGVRRAPQLPPEAPVARPQRAPQMNREAPPPRRTKSVPPARGVGRPNQNQKQQEKLRRQNEQRARALQQMQEQGAAKPPPLVVTQRQVATPAAAAAASKRQGAEEVNRTDRLRSLLRPGNLRKEYILTEILQPPVSLRPESEI